MNTHPRHVQRGGRRCRAVDAPFARSTVAEGGSHIALLRGLAEQFQTTLTATAVRLVEEADEDCYVVFSHEGYVKWWRRNDHRSMYHLEQNQSIDPESLAWACTTAPDQSAGMKPVPAWAWFPHLNDIDSVEVWEESVLLSEYETVLTLLCAA